MSRSDDHYTMEEVDYQFGGMNSLSKEFRSVLAKALTRLPKKIVELAAKDVIFISSNPEEFAFFLPTTEWKHKKGFIFLSDILLQEPEEKQAHHIAHEIAHVKLKHKSAIFGRLTKEKHEAQEKEANKLAEKWLS